jgi:hypothetical protein
MLLLLCVIQPTLCVICGKLISFVTARRRFNCQHCPATSVYLQYFMRGEILPPMTYLVLRCCLEGLEDFFALVLNGLVCFAIYCARFVMGILKSTQLTIFCVKSTGYWLCSTSDTSMTTTQCEQIFVADFRDLKSSYPKSLSKVHMRCCECANYWSVC